MNTVVKFDDEYDQINPIVTFDDPIEDDKNDHAEQNEPMPNPDSDLMFLTNQLNAQIPQIQNAMR